MAGNPVATINAQLSLESANFSTGLDRASAKARAAASDIQSAFSKVNFGEAVEKTFSRARLGLIEEGGAKIGFFGSALEALGPVGLAAGAAIAGVAYAAEQARKAMEWGDDLDRTAKTLGITTTFLQEFDAASIATSVGLVQGRAGLTSFSETLGKFSSGLATAKQTKWFDALGFTREGAANTSNLRAELEKALTALAAVPNASQRAAFAKGLGLTELLPIVASGTEGIEEFLAAMERAKDGHVVSPEEVARLAQLNDKVEELSHDISIDFKKAFVELAPTIETVAEFIERCARALSDFTSKIPDAVRGMGSIADFEKQISSLLGLQKGWEAARQAGQRPLAFDAADQQRKMNDPAHPVSQFVNQVLFTTPSDLFNSAARSGWAKGMAGRVGNSLTSGTADFSFERSIQANDKKGGNYTPPKKGGADKSEEERRKAIEKATRSMEAVDTATKDELASHTALVTDIQERADLAAQEVDADTKRKNDKLRGDAAQGKIDAISAQRAITLNETAGAEKKLKIARDAEAALADRQLSQSQAINAFYDQILQIGASMARSAAERRDIELKLLASERRQADAAIEKERQDELRGADTQGQRDSINSFYDSKKASNADLFVAKTAQVRKDTEGPLEQWREKSLETAAQIQEAYEGVATRGLDALTEGITGAITGTESLGDAFHNVATSIIADLVKIAVQRSITQPLADALFPSGGGGLFSGLTSGIGSIFGGNHDRGGSFVMGGSGGMDGNLVTMGLSKGERVDITRPDQMRDSSGGIVFDLRGAVMTQDLLEQMQAMADGAEVRATITGSSVGSANAQTSLGRRQAQKLGR